MVKGIMNAVILSLDFLRNLRASITNGIVVVLVRVVQAGDKTPKTDGRQREEKLRK